jgi:hypothetical protein
VPPAKPARLAEIINAAGVVPPAGLTESQVPPDAAAVKVNAAALLVTFTLDEYALWSSPSSPPPPKDRCRVLSRNKEDVVAGLVTTSVTATACGELAAPPAAMATLPW